MKLFAATLAVASAQDFAASEAGDDARTFSFGDSAFDYGDSYGGFEAGAFYDSAYGSDYGSLAAAYNYDDADAAAADADAAVADEAGRDKDEARYFGVEVVTDTTTTTTTTTRPTPGTSYCLKCDTMTAANCAVGGDDAELETCEADDVCFLEVRRSITRSPSGKQLTQICTGCKHKQACYDLKAQNSITGLNAFFNIEQCHPLGDGFSPRLGEVASVCRTCFLPSNLTPTEIADPSETEFDNDDKFINGGSTTLTIPDGTADGFATVTLYGNADNTAFYANWFTDRHGIPHTGSNNLDFSMDSPN